MSGPWKRRYRPTVTEQDQIELIFWLVFGGGSAIALALYAAHTLGWIG